MEKLRQIIREQFGAEMEHKQSQVALVDRRIQEAKSFCVHYRSQGILRLEYVFIEFIHATLSISQTNQ